MIVLLTMCLLGASVFVSEGQDAFSDSSKIGNWQGGDPMQEVTKRSGEMLEALLDREEDKCYGRRCDHSEECCTGAACVDIEGVSGTCLPVHGGRRAFYQACRSDSDCGAGLSCTDSGNSPPAKTCQLEGGSIVKKKGFNDECVTSSECDTDRGLCCQILRRHRMAARRVCHYFLDPQSCVGAIRNADPAKQLPFVANPFFKARMG